MLKFIKKMFGSNNNSLNNALKGDVFLVDVRSPGEFSSGSVKNAVNIPLDKLSTRLPKFKGKERILVFCQSGNRSGQAKKILEQNGYKNVINGGSWLNVKKAINQSVEKEK